MQILISKGLLPTNLDTAALRELDAALRAQSFYSAQTSNAYLLQLYRDRIAGILNPQPAAGESTTQFSPAYVRSAIKDFLTEVNYQPAPEDAGTIRDLSSDARVNLVIKTNRELAQGQGMWIKNQQPALLNAFPGQELFRAESREQPREWLMRWRLAGSQTGDPIGKGWTITTDERMIALKNHPIWTLIGSSALFKDALDVFWPPFAFNSGMWVRDVDYDETAKIGLIKSAADIPKPVNLSAAFAEFAKKMKQLTEAA